MVKSAGGVMSFTTLIGWCAIFVVTGTFSARADDLDRQVKALEVIRQFAAETCTSVAQEGSSQSTELSGKAKAKLGGVVGKLADLGFDGGGTYKSESYTGVLQRDLAAAIKHSADCRLEVLRLLQSKLLLPARTDDRTPAYDPNSGRFDARVPATQRSRQQEMPGTNTRNSYPSQGDTYPDGLPKVFPGGIPNVISRFGNAYGYPGGR